jgi:hypothetical protein
MKNALLFLLLLPAVYAISAETASFTIDKFHMGSSGDNPETASFTSRDTLTYEQGSNPNGGTSNFLFNLGWFNETIVTAGETNLTITLTAAPSPVTVGSTLTYQITLTPVGGTAFNVTLVEIYPSQVTFNGSTPPPTIGNDTFVLGNISSTTTINKTVNVTVAGTLVDTVIVNFTNLTGSAFSTNVSLSVTAFVPSPNVQGGGSGGGGTASTCNTICLSPLYENSPQCARCKQVQQPTCIEQWRCGEWSQCENGKQFRSCQDLSNCRTYTFRPATEQNCGQQTERPEHQESGDSYESTTTVEQSAGTITRKQPKTLFSVAGFNIMSKHIPLIVSAATLYAILLGLIIWHNRRNHAPRKQEHKLNFKPTRKK